VVLESGLSSGTFESSRGRLLAANGASRQPLRFPALDLFV
jgi:hypothetical protein